MPAKFGINLLLFVRRSASLFFLSIRRLALQVRVTYAGTDPSSPRRTAPGPLPAGSTEARRRADTCWPLPARPRPLRGRGGQAPPSRGRGVRCPASTWAGSALPRLHVGGACPGPARPQGAWALPWQPSLGWPGALCPSGSETPIGPGPSPRGSPWDGELMPEPRSNPSGLPE